MVDRTRQLPGPLVSMAIEAKAKGDQERLTQSLRQLVAEDPSLLVSSDQETGQTIISGTSEEHLRVIVDRVSRHFELDTNVGKLRVAYRETVRSAVEREAKFVRQTGGNGEYAHVVLRVEPLKDKYVCDFIDAVNGGVVPPKYVPAVEKGVAETARTGVLAGYPMVGIRVTLLDGSYHEVDSTETAFKIAAAMAFKEAAALADPVVLEPMMFVEIVVPDEFVGEVVADLSTRRGMIQRIDSRDGARVIRAEVVLARMLGYAADLRRITEGRATHTMEFKTYVEVGPLPDPDGNEPASMALRVA